VTILAELAALYDRMPDLPRPGYSREAIGGEIVLGLDGTVIEMNVLAAPDERGKLRPRSISVPAAIKRASDIQTNLFWDKSAYVLGVVVAIGDDGKPLLDHLGHTSLVEVSEQQMNMRLSSRSIRTCSQMWRCRV